MEAILLETDPAGDRDLVAIAAGSIALLYRVTNQYEIGWNATAYSAVPAESQLPGERQSYN